MRILKQNFLLPLICIIVFSVVCMPLSFGYSMYVNGHFVGNVRSPQEARAILSIIHTEYDFPVPAPTLYLCLLPASYYTRSARVLDRAKQAVGIKTFLHFESLSIPYGKEEQADPLLYQGEKETVQAGMEGRLTRLSTEVFINQSPIEREILSDVVIAPPTEEIVRIGTKEKRTGVGTGTFIFPLAEITVSSPFGARWGSTHTGLDFSASSGTSILAADSGTVTYSGWCEGYGNLIILDHRNGMTSYYAHCSALYAKTGDMPIRGECIAAVGSTGRSTGPHLHFEIRENQVPKNPQDYLPK